MRRRTHPRAETRDSFFDVEKWNWGKLGFWFNVKRSEIGGREDFEELYFGGMEVSLGKF